MDHLQNSEHNPTSTSAADDTGYFAYFQLFCSNEVS
jgi:hypothetical protein